MERFKHQEGNTYTFYAFVSCDGPLHVNEKGISTPWKEKSPPVSFNPIIIGPPRERDDHRPLNTEGDDIETVQNVLRSIALHMHHEACPSCDRTPIISPLVMQ